MKLKQFFQMATALLIAIPIFISCAGGNDMGGVMMDAYAPFVEGNQEEYTEIVENDFIKTTEQPSSYFSIDANTASYPNFVFYYIGGLTNVLS